MKPKLLLLSILAAFALGGCKGPTASESGTGSLGTGSPKATTPDATPSTTSTAQKTPPGPEIPEALKTDAYHWYGLGNTTPMNIEVKTGPRTVTGVQTNLAKEVKAGKAVFEIQRSGELETLFGTETLSLEKDGVYTVKSTEFAGPVRNLEMPSDLTPGKTWNNDGKFKRTNGESLVQKLSFTVVGPQKVTTPVGEQDALYITSTGNMSSSGTRYRMESRFWYVKDKGLVKMVIKMQDLTDKKAAAQEITYQETK